MQQPALQQPNVQGLRFAPVPPTGDQYEQLLQRQHIFQNKLIDPQQQQNLLKQQQQQQVVQNHQLLNKLPVVQQQTQSVNLLVSSTTTSEQEIPDNVTAEIEKLEEETGTMVELQGVSDILGGLGEEDDELLGKFWKI